jgi:hypothetical protein
MSTTPLITGSAIQQTLFVPDINLAKTKYQQLLSNGIAGPGIDYLSMPGKDHTLNLEQIEAPAFIFITSALSSDPSIKYMTNKFFLESIAKPKMERFQILETFGDSKLLFFGERTKVYTITGMLLEGLDNTQQDDQIIQLKDTAQLGALELRNQYRWSTGLQTFWDAQLRGSLLASNGYIANLYTERALLVGYPLQLQVVRDTNSPFLVNFQMTWAVFSELFIDPVVGTYYSGQNQNSTNKNRLNAWKTIYMNKVKLAQQALQNYNNATAPGSAVGPSSNTNATALLSALQQAQSDQNASYEQYLTEVVKYNSGQDVDIPVTNGPTVSQYNQPSDYTNQINGPIG